MGHANARPMIDPAHSISGLFGKRQPPTGLLISKSPRSKPVKIRRRLREQRRLLGLAVLRGDTFERVEDHLIAALALVGREVALEHAAFGAEGLDAGLDIGTPRRGGVFRRWRHRALVKIIAE